jgi:hypothetical protein
VEQRPAPHGQRGANPKELMARMGHDSERAALIYLHSSAERQRTLADEVGRMAAAELARSKTAKPSGTLTAREPNGPDGPADGKSPDLGAQMTCAPTATRTRDLPLRRRSVAARTTGSSKIVSPALPA